MMKLRILNMNGFLEVVNACRGAVYVVAAGGQKRDIRGNAVFQRYLLGEHRRGGGSLCLTLDVPQPSDYMDVVCWYIGE